MAALSFLGSRVRLRPFIPFLLAFVLPLLLIYAWWGGFNPVHIEVARHGPYTYAYLEHTGDYAKLPDIQMRVARELEAQGITPGLSINVLYSNPDLVAREQRRARTGFLLPPGATVREPLRTGYIPAREVLTARVRAAVLLAPSRAYLALDRYQQALGQGIRMPTVEIHTPSERFLTMGELRVEMPLTEADAAALLE